MRKKFAVRLKRRQMLAKHFVFIPSMMSQHNSTQVPKYAAAGQESQTSKGRRNASNLKTFFAQMIRTIRETCLVEKKWGGGGGRVTAL